jgi:Sulfotransferase domain
MEGGRVLWREGSIARPLDRRTPQPRKRVSLALQIVGTGLGRTGTMSTQSAPDRLGFGSCHQMVEVMHNPAQPAHWKAIAAGGAVKWADALDGHATQV